MLLPLLSELDDHDLHELQIVTAARVVDHRYPQADPSQPLLIADCDQAQMGDLLDRLRLLYPESQSVTIISKADSRELPLGEVGREALSSAITALLVWPLERPATFCALQDIVARLRAPDGCPWDRELTWSKLRTSLLEEAHELLAALDEENAAEISEELGDLLLQIALLVQIGIEQGSFRLVEVIDGIVTKLIRRHPHVFGGARVESTEEVLSNWEAIKRSEREINGSARSPLAGVPAGLPALACAQAYLDRMARLGPVPAPETLMDALTPLLGSEPITEDSVGEALRSLVAWIRQQGIDAESALRLNNHRFAAQVLASESAEPSIV